MELNGAADWRKSTYSTANGAQCVEVGTGASGIMVRDTTDPEGGTLAFPAGAWGALLARVRVS